MVSFKEVMNAPSTMAPATSSVMSLVKSQHEKGNYISSRAASLLMAPALVVNCPSHLVLGIVKAVVATGMKVIEVAAAVVGFKDLNLNRSTWTSNYTGQQAAHHLGKATLGTAVMLGAAVIGPLMPSVQIKAADTFGFASTSKKPIDQAKETANSVWGWCKQNVFTPVKDGAVKAGKFVAEHKYMAIAGAAVAGGAYAWYQGMLEGTGAKVAEWTPNFIKEFPCNLSEWVPGSALLQNWSGCVSEKPGA